MPSERDVLKISVRMRAILLWSSLRIRGEILSGPAAFPGFNLRSCLDTQETDIVMFCIDGELRCRSFRRTSLVKTDWNWVFKMLALSVFILLVHYD